MGLYNNKATQAMFVANVQPNNQGKNLLHAAKGRIKYLMQLWQATVLQLSIQILKMCNQECIESYKFNSVTVKRLVWQGIHESGSLGTGAMHKHNSLTNLVLIKFDLPCCKPVTRVKEVKWYPSKRGVLKANGDGCSIGYLD